MLENKTDIKKQKLDLLLINPSINYFKDQKSILARRVEDEIIISNSPSPGIAYLLAVAKQNKLNAKFIDMVAESITIDNLIQYINTFKPTIIGFTALTVQIKSAGFIAEKIKNLFPDILICVGGIHSTVMPKETLSEFSGFDFVVCGEGELVLINIFNNLKKGISLSTIKGVVTREKMDFSFDRIKDLNMLPFPAWEEIDITKYTGIYPHRTKLELPVWTSRGCPFSCIFCARSFGRHRIHRSIASVISEIERNILDFGCESIAFIDETFIVDLKWSSELFNTMITKGINKKITWSCETRVDIATPEFFRLMKDSGCYYIFFGFESADENILKSSSKNITIAQMKKAVKWTKEAGIITSGSFIIGLPGETEETVKKSIALAQELGLYSVTFPIAVPFPGTILRKMAINHDYGLKILTDNWDDYDKQYPGVMESEQLSIEKRRELQKLAYTLLPKKKIQEYIKKELEIK
ncbi:MAG: radical SAM protein [Elusimicrobiota bacterium]